ncbi:MAG: glycosyltransferase family 39 protein [Anaerolineae bacterium]
MNSRSLARLIAPSILLLALGVRVIGIADVPPGLSGDEAINGADALEVLRGHTPIFFTDNYGREAAFIYSMALTIRLIGANVLAIRLPAIACGVGGVLFTYVLVRRLWSARVAILSAALMSVSLWPIFVSRIGLRAISMVPLEALALYGLWRGLERRRTGWWLVFGACLGLLPYTYIPGRIFPLVSLLWLVSTRILTPRQQPPELTPSRLQLALALLVALAIFAPFGLYMLRHPEQANQRIGELSYLLDSARMGNFAPLAQNAFEALKMFTFRGDEFWRYNVANRPLFDWVTGACFYTGVLLCLMNLRRPRNQLLLIWLIVMLTPSILSAGAPSFLRSVGAMTPIYVFPAIALDAGGRALPQVFIQTWRRAPRLPRVRRGYRALLALWLVAVAARDGLAYFHTWPNTPRTREIYVAGLAQVGRQLDKLASHPTTPEVLIGADFATDYARDMVDFQTRYAGPIRWFIGRDAVVFPYAPQGGHDAYYLFADAPPPETLFEPIARTSDRLYRSASSNGQFESAAYRLPGHTRTTLPWQPASPLTGRFEDSLALLGYTLPAEAPRGGHITLVVYWQVPSEFQVEHSAPLWFSVKLKDVTGNIWDARANLLPYPSWDWRPGDVVAQQITLPVAEDMPPGERYVAFEIERSQRELTFLAPNHPPTTTVHMGPLTAVGTPKAEVREAEALLGATAEIALEGTLMVDVAMPGDPLHTTFYWRARARPQMDYAARLQIREPGCEGAVIHSYQLPLWPDVHPTSRWQPGEPVRTLHHPTLPRDLSPGSYGIEIALVPIEASDDTSAGTAPASLCRPLEIIGHVRTYTVPDIEMRVDQPLTDGITFLGADAIPPLEEIEAGDEFELRLYWQATDAPTASYTVFAHIYAPDGQLVSQDDGTPCGGTCPTHTWVAGEVLTDSHQLSMPQGSAPGPYTIGVGMYDLTTMERLEIRGAPENVILLDGLTLR